MAKESPKGSIIYKIIIVILSLVLIFTILYPKALWQKETVNTKSCRENMEHIMSAQLLYMMYNNNYNDTLRKVVDFVTEDTTNARLVAFLKMDSILTLQIINALRTQDTLGVLIDSMRVFCRETGIDTTEQFIIDSLRTFQKWASFIDSMTTRSLDSLFVCPTVRMPYKLTVIDTSVIKMFVVTCPIDSLDSLKVASDFMFKKLGALSISNHGSIDGGNKNWK